MSQWKNRIDEPGWYWCWHDHDWGYKELYSERGRQPELYLFFKIKEKYAVGARNIILTESTFAMSFEKTNWFWGPIKMPKPPLPTEEYINNLRESANINNFEPLLPSRLSKLLGFDTPEEDRNRAKEQLEIVLKRIAEYDKK